ncbi:MAG: hypothetical protein KGM96_06980 [Acidobacteriota bacterium]|nr:hypothetical protein [Acidobacteriota bacterium]
MLRCIVVLFLSFAICSSASPVDETHLLRLDREIVLPGVQGRIDHLAADVAGQRVFVADLGNGTVEAIALDRGARVGQINGLKHPQGIVYVPANKTVYVASGGDGMVRSYDGRTLKPLKSVDLGDDADNLRYDAGRRLVLAGYGSGAIAELGLDLTRRDDLRLPVHPEAFQLSADEKRLYVNLPLHMSVAAIDMDARAVNATWGHPGTLANFPMALDSAHGRMFVACRMPARLLMMNIETGAVMERIATVGDADDLFYDAARGNIYVIGGGGFVDVVRVGPGNKLASVAHVPTAPGARTGLFVPEWNKLLVAAPRRGTSQARLLVYSVAGPQPAPAAGKARAR